VCTAPVEGFESGTASERPFRLLIAGM